MLLLDLDAAVLRPRQLLSFFAPLSHYDLVGVMEGFSRGWDGTDTARRNDSLAAPPDPTGRGWEVNTGVLAVRKQAAWLVGKWGEEFTKRVELYSRLTGVDQSALMLVLARESRARLFAMPPSYNFRAPTLYAAELGGPVVLHTRAAMRVKPAAHRASMGSVAETVAGVINRAVHGGGGGEPGRSSGKGRGGNELTWDSGSNRGGGGRGGGNWRGAMRLEGAATIRELPPRNCRQLPGGCAGKAAIRLAAGAAADTDSAGTNGRAPPRNCRQLPGGCAGKAATRLAAAGVDLGGMFGPAMAAENGSVVNGPTPTATRSLRNLTGSWCMRHAGCMASWWRPSDLDEARRRSLTHAWRLTRPRAGCLLPDSPRTAGATPDCSCFAPNDDIGRQAAPCPKPGTHQPLAPAFEGEFGFELLHGLPFLHWLHSCNLLRMTRACGGMRPFYYFSGQHQEISCDDRPSRSHWRGGTLPDGVADGWSWFGKQSARFYAYPSGRWKPPPLHARYASLPLPLLDQTRPVRRVYVSNKFYPEGSGKVENFFSLRDVQLILDTLLPCGFQVIYNHPSSDDIGASTPDANDRGRKTIGDGKLGDLAMMRQKYAAQLAAGTIMLLPSLGGNQSALSFNEVQLRAVARSGCFLVPQGGAGVMAFYQPGFHVVHDVTGKERCRGGSGEYFQYFAQLPQGAGESIVYNTQGDPSRLVESLRAMCDTRVCERAQARPGVMKTPAMPRRRAELAVEVLGQ